MNDQEQDELQHFACKEAVEKLLLLCSVCLCQKNCNTARCSITPALKDLRASIQSFEAKGEK